MTKNVYIHVAKVVVDLAQAINGLHCAQSNALLDSTLYNRLVENAAEIVKSYEDLAQACLDYEDRSRDGE